MKLFKKLMVCSVAIVATLALSVTAFAASPKDDVVNALKSAGVPTHYVTQASNYLATINLTAAQASEITAQITAAKNAAGSATSFSDLTAAQKETIANDMAKAGDAINVKVNYNTSTGAIDVLDSNGNSILDGVITTDVPSANPEKGSTAISGGTTTNGAPVASATTSSDGVVKTTGVNMYATVAVLAVLAIALVACGVAVSKKNANHAA